MSEEKDNVATQTKRPSSNWENLLTNFYTNFLPYNPDEELEEEQELDAQSEEEFEKEFETKFELEKPEEWEKDTTDEYTKSGDFYSEIRQFIQQFIQQAQVSGKNDEARALENIMINFDKIVHTLETEIKPNRSKEERENLSIQLSKDLQATIKSIVRQ